MKSAFSGATLMITGGTGSFGNTVLKHFLHTDIGQVRIFSRDEKKQDDMRHELQIKYPEIAKRVKFLLETCGILKVWPMLCQAWIIFSMRQL